MDIFNKSVQNSKNIKKKLSNTEKLDLYKYYKQVKFGDNKEPKPWAVQVEARAKWEAWESVKGMKKEDAIRKYTENVNKHLK